MENKAKKYISWVHKQASKQSHWEELKIEHFGLRSSQWHLQVVVVSPFSVSSAQLSLSPQQLNHVIKDGPPRMWTPCQTRSE